MRRRLFLPTLLAGLGLLQGCPGTFTQLNRLPESSPLPLPQAMTIAASGDYLHEASRVVFPAALAGFQRAEMFRFDTGTLDVSGHYRWAAGGCRVTLTAYVAPAVPRMSFVGADPALVRATEARWLAGAYERWKAEIAGVHAGVQPLQEETLAREGAPVRHAVYAFDGERSELFVAVLRQAWILTERISFPAACAEQVRPLNEAFVAAWPVLAP